MTSKALANALTKIQVITGNHFAQAQGGTYSSPAAAECIEFMKKAGAYGVGQSSWGPALYAVVKQEEAKAMLFKSQSISAQKVWVVKHSSRKQTTKAQP